MTAQAAVGLALVVVLAAAGLAWQECLLLVAASIAALRLELWQLGRAAPSDAWRVGARCLVAGGAGLLGAAALGTLLLASTALGWQPSHEHSGLAISMILAAGVVVTALQSSASRAVAEATLWLIVVLVAAASLAAEVSSGGAWACAASGAGVAFLAWTSWRLASDGASFLRFD